MLSPLYKQILTKLLSNLEQLLKQAVLFIGSGSDIISDSFAQQSH